MSTPVSQTALKFEDSEGNPTGKLCIWSMRKSDNVGLKKGELSHSATLDWLTESSIYGYELILPPTKVLSKLEPSELFDPDWSGALRGRLRTGNRAGILILGLTTADGIYSTSRIDIKSSKLSYDNEFQWMLRDITTDFFEAALARFGATQLSYAEPTAGESSTLYHKFSFLRALLESEDFVESIQMIIANPYVAWQNGTRTLSSSKGLRVSQATVRAISSAGPRRSLPAPLGALAAIPRSVSEQTIRPEVDNLPNQYIKSLIEDWRNIAQSVYEALKKELVRNPSSSPALRGLAESERVIDELDVILALPLFQKISRLTQLPAGNQVLLKREGYREILRLHRQTYLTAALEWNGAEHVFGAGMRDVATLYEYWVFLQLGTVIAHLCDRDFDFTNLFSLSASGLQLNLSKRRAQVLKGQVVVADCPMQIELWFNRPFQKNSGEAWTRNMRPDFSLSIKRVSSIDVEKHIWIHFDAKYRVDHLFELFGSEDEIIADGDTNAEERVLRSDLLKMHAYRDAIHRSSGAYVIYPGHGNSIHDEVFLKYHELLPGLGAFSLRPTQEGGAIGTEALSSFLRDAIWHVGNVLTADNRLRFWTEKIMTAPFPSANPAPSEFTRGLTFLDRPPSDEQLVLLRSSQESYWDAQRERFVISLERPLPSRFFSTKWILLIHEDRYALTLLWVDNDQTFTIQDAQGGKSACLIELLSLERPAPDWLSKAIVEKILDGQTLLISNWGSVADSAYKYI